MDQPRLRKHHKDIIGALTELGGQASIKEIAERAGLDTNGVSQALSSAALSQLIQRANPDQRWQGGDERFRLAETEPTDSQPGDQEQLF